MQIPEFKTRTLFIISSITCVLVILMKVIDMYQSILLGAVYEFLWFATLTSFILLPIYVLYNLVADIFLKREKHDKILWLIPVLHIVCYILLRVL